MLFMVIASFTPEQTPAIQKIGIEKGFPEPEGMKVIGEWGVIGGGCAFRVIDVDDTSKLMDALLPYSGLCSFEVLPLIDIKEGIKKLRGQ